MKKDYCMVIKNGLTGEEYKIPNAQMLNTKAKEAVIESYTEQLTEQNIGYYVSYMYEY